jgi:predicted metal-dependent phosphoesterase TrpH
VEVSVVIKAELHAHTADDPMDRVPHSAEQLIERAAEHGYGALAITLHDRPFDPTPLVAFARERGVVLIPGLERTVEGRHVILLNFPLEAIEVQTLDDVARLKAATNGLVIAPHPFYPIPSALGLKLLETHLNLWDAVEVSALYVRGVDFSTPAIAWARRHGKPLVGNADVHRLSQLDTTWSEIDAPPDASAICEAIRAGRVRVVTRPLGYGQAVRIFTQMTIGGLRGRLNLP